MIGARTVTLVLVVVAVAVLAVAMAIGVSPRGPGAGRLARRPDPALPGLAVAALSAFEARLSDRHPDTPAPPDVRRNPFTFASRAALAGAAGASSARRPVLSTRPLALPPVPPPPLVSLAGIAEDRRGAAVVRTAVLSLPDGVVLARDGERVGGRFDVLRVAEDAVRLRDAVTGAEFTLTLR